MYSFLLNSYPPFNVPHAPKYTYFYPFGTRNKWYIQFNLMILKYYIWFSLRKNGFCFQSALKKRKRSGNNIIINVRITSVSAVLYNQSFFWLDLCFMNTQSWQHESHLWFIVPAGIFSGHAACAAFSSSLIGIVFARPYSLRVSWGRLSSVFSALRTRVFAGNLGQELQHQGMP